MGVEKRIATRTVTINIFSHLKSFLKSFQVSPPDKMRLALLLVTLTWGLGLVSAKGDLNDFNTDKQSIAPERIAAFYSENVIKGANKPEERCSDRVFASRAAATEGGKSFSLGVIPTVSLGAALLIFFGVGVFAAGIAQAFQMVRKHVYHDADNLDTAFDAGGKVSIGLTATTIVSQWTWSATLLQSSTVASKYGISGPYWYAGGATIQIIIFSILSIMLKSRAPGAKTFLQISSHRGVWRPHPPKKCDQSPLRNQDPPGLLHLRLLHQPHRDDVPHRGRNCSPEQPCG